MPGDSLEREADRLADGMVGAGPVAPAVRPSFVFSPPAASGTYAPLLVDQALQASGQPLAADQRAWFEPRLGRSLAGVRVHTGVLADASARAIGARAYTAGNDVVFGAGQYAPYQLRGQRLLAHELVHVAQQGASGLSRQVQRSVVDSGVVDPSEGELPLPSGPAPTPDSGGGGEPMPETCDPPVMECLPASDSPAASHEFVFPVGSATLNPMQVAEINAVAAAWHAGGASGGLRIDGYASAEGQCSANWDLSCRRAQAVRNELAVPSDGSPGVSLSATELLAHGESAMASPGLALNRRATIAATAPPPAPGPDPEPGPEPTPPACPLPVSLGSARGCGGKDDFAHHDLPSISSSSEARLSAWAATHPPLGMRPFRSLITDLECELEMAGVLSGLAGTEGFRAFAHFVGGSGSTVTHGAGGLLGVGDPLGNMALSSGSFAATVATVKADIESQLAAQASGGSLNPCLLSVVPPATHFGFSDGVALKAVIGGTQGEELLCTGFSGSAALRTYSIDLRFKICDDFGVDESDLYGPGLFPFWVLQHERSASAYAPFINELDLSLTVSGTF